ncbi:MAG: hypothetical protein WCZ17_11455 [Candidatus Kapaibacterium sp.]
MTIRRTKTNQFAFLYLQNAELFNVSNIARILITYLNEWTSINVGYS